MTPVVVSLSDPRSPGDARTSTMVSDWWYRTPSPVLELTQDVPAQTSVTSRRTRLPSASYQRVACWNVDSLTSTSSNSPGSPSKHRIPVGSTCPGPTRFPVQIVWRPEPWQVSKPGRRGLSAPPLPDGAASIDASNATAAAGTDRARGP